MALQQLAALKACVTAIVVLQRDGRPVRDAGALFQPAPVLHWLEAVAEALLGGAHSNVRQGDSSL
jgi:hypothetical protein